MAKKRLIIINRMYAGKYLAEGENIGHEIINLRGSWIRKKVPITAPD